MKKIFTYTRTYLLHNLKIMVIAILVDAIWGEPNTIYKKIPHPIIWIGSFIHYLDKRLNRTQYTTSQQKRNGFLALGLFITLPCIIGHIVQKILFEYLPKPIAYLISGLIGSIFIARRSLHEHVENVERALNQSNIEIARQAVSQIVGRKTEQLDRSAIARAAIESLAENFSDGVTAPIFWGCIAGLPGMITYKSINTADSMIGHKTKKYQFFGYAAAKTDDYVNYPASRLSALWIVCAASNNPISDLKYIAKEAQKHNSPNAGWPEAAMATCLSISLAGPRQYQENIVNTPWIGRGKKTLNQYDIQNALSIFSISCNIHYVILIAITRIINK